MSRSKKNPDVNDQANDETPEDQTEEAQALPELKACPACGDKAKIAKDRHGMFRCFCQACGFWDCAGFEAEIEAAQSWNAAGGPSEIEP